MPAIPIADKATLDQVKALVEALSKPRGCDGLSTFTTSSSTLQTVVEYNGKGELVVLSCKASAASSNMMIRVTLDGKVVVYGKLQSGSSNPQGLVGSYAGWPQDGSQPVMSTSGISPQLPFKTSCKIEISGDGTNSNTCGYVLAKE